MPYDETLTARIARYFADQDSQDSQGNIVSRKMFGGVAFMDHGNMCCGVIHDRLMVRVGKDAYEETLALPHADTVAFEGSNMRPMRGFITVAPKGLQADDDLAAWIKRGLAFTSTLPAK